MRAVVMAGGEGSRLRPLTSRRPKPLVPIAGRPVMHHIIALLRRHGITDIVATVHFLADEIEAYFGDGARLGVNLRYVVEDTPLGTAGAVKLAEPNIGDGDFLVISGDALTDMDLSALIEHHEREQNDVTIVLRHAVNPLDFGVVITDERGRITRFLEKPSWGEVFSDTINTGIYVLKRHVLDSMEAGRACDFSKELFPKLLHDGAKLGGYITQSYWADVGSLEQYQAANYDAIAGVVDTEPCGTEIEAGVWAEEDCSIDPTAQIIGPVRLGNGVRVAAGARIVGPSSIGDRVFVSERAVVDRTVLWEDAYVGPEASLHDCTIANRCVLKQHANVAEGCFIGERCMLGADARVRPHLKIWPDKTIPSGSIVSMSLIYGSKWPGSLFGGNGVEGIGNFEITPEYALKLGQAFGSFMRPGQHVMVGRSSHPVSRVMNRCIIAGLMGSGVHVDELHSVPVPVARFETREHGDGGVYVRVSPANPNAIFLEFFDANGINLDKGSERSIESLFFREDFRRPPIDEVGRLDTATDALDPYGDAFLRALSSTPLTRSFRLVVDYAHENSAIVLPRILGNLGMDVTALNATMDDDIRALHVDESRDRRLSQLSGIVRTVGADLGILVDHGGERFALVDDAGRAIDAEQLLVVMTLLVVRAYPNAYIGMPVTVPQAVEQLAQNNGGTIVRTKSDRRSLMELAQKLGSSLSFAGSAAYEVIFPEFHAGFDGIYGAARALAMLANERLSLSTFVDMLPEWYMAERSIACPWEEKGRIMRTLIDQERRNDVETLDGLRINERDGWVLVLPDSSDPVVKVIAEGTSAQTARDYADRMSARIAELVEH
jgi:mannose-1-phosphate guanylyltransferase/phosphomannomutase